MQRVILFMLCLMCFFVINCSNSENEVVGGRYDKAVPSVDNQPLNIDSYAIAGNGKVVISGALETDGSLADILSNESIEISSSKSILTGSLYSKKIRVSSKSRYGTESILKNSDDSVIKLKSVRNVLSDTSEAFSGYKLLADGTVQKLSDGIVESTAADFYNDSFRFSDNQWKLEKENLTFTDPVIIEGDLVVTGRNIVISSPLFVTGNLKSSNRFEIDINQPFEKALTVDGNIEVSDLSVVGKIEALGDVIVNGDFDLIGTIKSQKSIIINGNARINYLDTIYKAALAGAQSEFEETLLAHSQVFKDLEGRNAMVLFTFARSYVLTNEANILSSISSGTVVGSDYYSKFVGATLDYGTTIGFEDGLSIYYSNKLFVENYLKGKGYSRLDISETLYIESDSFYITYSDDSGNKIGTYKIYGSGLDYTNAAEPVVFSDEERDVAKVAMEKARAERLAAENEVSASKSAISRSGDNITIAGRAYTKTQLSKMGVKAEDLEKTPAELRLQEWAEYKDLDEEEITVEVAVQDDSTGKSINKGWKKKFKKIKKHVRKTVSNVLHVLYHTEWNKDFIDGVNESKSDIWTQNVYLRNPTGDCGPISAAMILIYHDRMKNVSINYNLASERIYAIANPAKYLSWLKPYCHEGSTPDQLDGYAEDMMDDLGISGSSSLVWYSQGFTFQAVLNRVIFGKFRDNVRDNQPSIVQLYNDNYIPGKDLKHFMPVIGCKVKERKVLGVDTVIFDETYLYTDTTWGYKKYWRFDWYKTPVYYRSMVEVDVD